MTDLSFSTSKFDGPTHNGRFHGEAGEYTFADGTVYRGGFKNGMFHGQGTLTFENGVFEGTWDNGREAGGQFIFNDGLPFTKENWNYCSVKDRRFWSEYADGIKPAGETNRTDTGIKPNLPKGCFDVGNGYYDPTTKKVHEYDTGTELRKPSDEELKWIETKAPIHPAGRGWLACQLLVRPWSSWVAAVQPEAGENRSKRRLLEGG
eukprot:CAMPEP_0119541512 /NCGR_PEP_ID=MMETSP1344-20130328/53000_1 /TAXON_ID=236787 /ORGANISM="Florenciella parvula, Strain CCMP2471" /LENGTH=205 /DNA_ID=CAMNT_0007585501 /DNA_START=124 /DNA_END=738 /DNA_ORIENTATION=-